MLNIDKENSLIFAIKKNLKSPQKIEDRIFDKKVSKIFDKTSKGIYIPYIENEDAVGLQNFLNNARYCFDSLNKLVCIQTLLDDNYIDCIYLIDAYNYEKVHSKLIDDFHILTYNQQYKILEDEVMRLYDVVIDDKNTNLNKICVEYDETGNLKKINVKNDYNRTFFEIFDEGKIENLVDIVKNNVLEVILESVSTYSRENGQICFAGLEYFYDGAAIDLGLRIGLQKERLEIEAEYGTEIDVREEYAGDYSFYEKLFDNCKLECDTERLFQNFKRVDFVEDSGYTYGMLIEFVDTIQNKLKSIDLKNYADVSDDFLILEPYECD